MFTPQTAAAVFTPSTRDTQQNGWNTAGSIEYSLTSKIVCIPISDILRQNIIGILKSYIHAF